MNRKIITRIIGITFTAFTLSFFPAMGMNLFQKATETAKKVTQAVVNTGAKAAADAVVGVGKIAGTIENDCVELSDKIKQKIGDHERNKQSNIADSVDTILNTPINEVIDAPQTSLLVSEGRIQKPDPADRKSKSSKSDSSSSSDSDDVQHEDLFALEPEGDILYALLSALDPAARLYKLSSSAEDELEDVIEKKLSNIDNWINSDFLDDPLKRAFVYAYYINNDYITRHRNILDTLRKKYACNDTNIKIIEIIKSLRDDVDS